MTLYCQNPQVHCDLYCIPGGMGIYSPTNCGKPKSRTNRARQLFLAACHFSNHAPREPQENNESVKDKRPVNLDLMTVRLPLPAYTSIAHRVSGAFIFVGIAVLLWLFAESLSSPEGFARTGQWLDQLWVKLLVWAVVAGLLYHLIAGIRHLLMDMGIGESLEGGLLGARLIVILSVVAIVLAGVWIW